MPKMTPRQRVRLALDHQEPDRVPTALGGGPYGIVDTLYFRLLEHLNLGEPIPPFRSGHNISFMDDRLFERLGVDTRYAWPGASPSSPSRALAGGDAFLDEFGQPWRRALPYFYPDRGMLYDATTLDDIDKVVTWPDPQDPRYTAGVGERARALHEDGEYFVVGRMVASYGPYQTACNLRGTEIFLMDLVNNQAFAEHLVERITDTLAGLMKGYLAAGGRYFDMIELPGDDYASNTNLVMSPAMFRKYFKPALSRLVSIVKDFNPNIKVMLHSDGLIQRLLPDMIEIGIDVVHPLEPLPAANLAEVKKQYGDKLSFLGGIDIKQAMPGSLADVELEAKTRIAQLAPGGGYVLAPANHLQADIPPENVVALYEAARKFGTYPIR